MKALEAKAVDKAKATADAAFRPSASVLNAKTADALVSLVDGPTLGTYDAKESVYVGRSVPLGAGKSLTVPIQVSVPGSVVDYSVEVPNYDVGLSIDAERDEGVTIVKVRNAFLRFCNCFDFLKYTRLLYKFHGFLTRTMFCIFPRYYCCCCSESSRRTFRE